MPLNDQLCGYKFSKRTLKYGYDIFKSFQPFLKNKNNNYNESTEIAFVPGTAAKKMEGDKRRIFEIEWGYFRF
jgi:hypothetical protein